MKNEAGYLVGVLPYLKTSKRVRFRGLVFCSSDDLAGLTSEEHIDLELIRALFYLRDDYRIDKIAYCVIRFANKTERQRGLARLAEAQVLIAYLYSGPQGFDCRVAVHSEYASLFVFHKEPVNTFLVRPDENVVKMLERTLPESDSRHEVPGWFVERNGVEHFWVERDSRIDAPLRQMYLFKWLDLFKNLVEGPTSGRKPTSVCNALSLQDDINVRVIYGHHFSNRL